MALFKKIDLVAYRHRLEVQQSTLPLSLVFNEAEKKEVAIIYQELIAICDKAIERNKEKEKPPFIPDSWLNIY